MRLFYFTCWQYVVLYVLLYVILLILLNDQPERANHTCKLFLLTQIVYLGNKAYFETLYYWKFLSLNSFSLCFTAGKLKKRSLIRFLGISSSISSGKSMARVSSNILIGIKSLKTFILPSIIILRAFVNGSVSLNWDSSSLNEWRDYNSVKFNQLLVSTAEFVNKICHP